MNIALVTGASSGLGAAFIRRLDQLGGLDEIWGVSRREGRMEALAAELRTPMRSIALDLTKMESVEALRACWSGSGRTCGCSSTPPASASSAPTPT